MTLFPLIAQGVSLGFSATVSPGPFLAYVCSETLSRGGRHTASLMLSPLVSDAPIILIAVLILGQLPPDALRLIQIVGGLFVLWLAWGMVQELRAGAAITLAADAAPPRRHLVLHGATINFFSPGAWIFWSTVNGPIVVQAWRDSPPAALAFMVSFYAVLVLGIGGWIAVFNQARRLDPRLIRGLMAVSAVIMVVFGLVLLRAGLFG